MAIFRNRRKAKEQQANNENSTNSSDISSSTAKNSKSLRRNKKNDAEVIVAKPVFNLDAALPDSTDFRTSLLMPGMSARFSLLREQYDPNTKIGKASDDSVLFPKRASRMNLFNHNPLTDIAEVESIYSTVRPPFADGDRTHSMSDGYNSDDGGSMMSRSRPREGNNLFSGRQKLYRIPAGATSSKTVLDGEAPAMGGKRMYEGDVHLSMFRKMRAKEREEREEQEAAARLANDRAISPPTEEQDEHYAVNSPSTAFSKNRGTTSSTTSGPSNRRTSTAATSVTSDSPITRQSNTSASNYGSKPRSSDYVNSSAEDISMKRNPSSESRRGNAWNASADQPPLPKQSYGLNQARSHANLNENNSRADTGFPIASGPAASSSPPTQNPTLASLDFGLKDSMQKPNYQARRYQTASPTAQLLLEEDGELYNKSVQPNDRGKATAMGLFNRPQQQFDEQQFLQRQMQMFEGRSSPLPHDVYPERRTSLEPTLRARSNSTKNVSKSPSLRNLKSNSITEESNSPSRVQMGHVPTPTTQSFSTGRSRARSSASEAIEAAAAVKAHVEALIKSQNAELAVIDRQDAVRIPTENNVKQRMSRSSRGTQAAANGTFFNSFDGSESETEQENLLNHRFESTPRLAPEDVHPALRNGTNDFHFGDEVAKASPRSQRQSSVSNFSTSHPGQHESWNNTDPAHDTSIVKNADSPTLGPGSGLGLSGLIATHLRQDSDKSSIIPPPSPGHSHYQQTLKSRQGSIASTARTANPPASVHSDPWEYENPTNTSHSPKFPPAGNDAFPSMSQKAQQILGHTMAGRSHPSNKAQRILGEEAPDFLVNDPMPTRSWQDDVHPTHRRGESSETQKERRALDNVLAERRKKINEQLKTTGEGESRPRSPSGRNDRNFGPTQPFASLRHKTSKKSMADGMNETQPKAMKMLGLASRPSEERAYRSPSPGMYGYDNRDHMSPNSGWRPHPGPYERPPPAQYQRPPPPMESQYHQGMRNGNYGRPQYPNGSNEDFERTRQRSTTPNSGRGPRRDRDYPDSAERSKSRQGRNREDSNSPTEYARTGSSNSPQNTHRDPPYVNSRDGRSYDRTDSAMSGRQRSGGRPPAPEHMDYRPAGHMMPPSTIHLPPRPSPRPPVLNSPGSPYNQGQSPGLSGPPSTMNSTITSPVIGSNQPPSRAATPNTTGTTPTVGNRKRSVTKTMISEPTFISSTSSVPLVGLPGTGSVPGSRPSPIDSPPLPVMNPRRRGNTLSDKTNFFNNGAQASPSFNPNVTDTASSSPIRSNSNANTAQSGFDGQEQSSIKTGSKPRNRLRKSSSEGGNMASKARQQAIAYEMGKQNNYSPAVPVFPNHSTTALGMRQDGAMF